MSAINSAVEIDLTGQGLKIILLKVLTNKKEVEIELICWLYSEFVSHNLIEFSKSSIDNDVSLFYGCKLSSFIL